MTVNRNMATQYKAVPLAADTNLPTAMSGTETGINEVNFIITGPQSNVVITETDSVTPANDAAVPVARLVFNSNDVDSGDVIVNESNFDVAAGATVIVGVFEGAYNDGIKCSVDSIALVNSRFDPTK